MTNAIEEITIETNTSERSGLATAALICSLIICCPITTLVGPILGIISLVTLKGRKGKGFAWTAIFVGVIATIVWVFVGVFIGDMAKQFITQTAKVTRTTIQAGYDGDYVLFREGLSKHAAQVSDEEIAAFIGELESRYGKFVSAMLNMEGSPSGAQQANTDGDSVPIRLVFESNDAVGEAVFEVVPQSKFEIKLFIKGIRIYDSKNGDIVFPEENLGETSPKSDDDGS
jgi:hypothetical protein